MDNSRPDRRQFLNSLGRVAVGGITLRGLGAVAPSPSPSAPGSTVSTNLKAYGSGDFGEWIEDEFGLPAYHYTCDQTTDPRAVTPVHTVWRSPTDHTHQVGNDRVVAAASNYGYVQVRQDEGSPKFLNDYSPERSQYGGGIGYLTDGRVVLSTFYPGNAKTFDRIFGVGYLRKKVASGDYAVDQVIFAPFGDDPLLISQVTIANHLVQRSKECCLTNISKCSAGDRKHNRAAAMKAVSITLSERKDIAVSRLQDNSLVKFS